MMDAIENTLGELDRLNNISSIALNYLACIVFGYVLKLFKKFPNEAIPLAVIMVGGLASLLLADPIGDGTYVRVWATRNFLLGIFIGFIAWMSHKFFISRIENYITSKFKDPDPEPAPQPKPNP